MKKNKLLVSVTTTKIYEYNTNADTSDLALDEFNNQTGKRFKTIQYDKTIEIHDFFKRSRIERRKK